MFTLSGAPSTTSLIGYSHRVHLRSPLGIDLGTKAVHQQRHPSQLINHGLLRVILRHLVGLLRCQNLHIILEL